MIGSISIYLHLKVLILFWVKLYFRFLDLLEGLFVILKLELIGIGILNFCAKLLVYLIN
jgi:hypothetical protein